jgi:hypothetical protein
MEYRRAYTYLFSRPDWIQTVLLLAVCVLIPVVGVLVLLGYRSEQLDDWLDEGTDEKVRPFDFNRFADLLMRGVWPFLYQLIIGMVFGALLGVMYIGVFMIAFGFANNKEPLLFFLILMLFYVFVFFVQVIVKFLSWPFVLHGQVSGKFDFGAAWTFAKDFYSKIGIANLGGIALCCMIIDVICIIIGMLLFCIGVYPAAAIVMMAEGHILWQLYRRHLERGGSSIPRFEKPRPRSRDEDNRPVDE